MKKHKILTLFACFIALGLAFMSCEINIGDPGRGDTTPGSGGELLPPGTGALRAIPTAAAPGGSTPVVVDSFTSRDRNFFLIHAGQIANTYISSVISATYYPGFGNPSYSRTTLTEQIITEATTETVSNSITVTNSSGYTMGIGAAFTYGFEGIFNSVGFTVSTNHTWNWSSSHSETGSHTFQTSVQEANRFAETRVTALTLSPGDPVGYHRIAMYARSNVYFVIATSLDNQELLDWRTVVAATGTFTVRQEFSDDGVFDNSPQGGNLIDFAEDFFRHLELDEIEATIFDFSNRSPPTGALTIARDIQRVVYRGQYNRGTVFNNVNIVVADRTTPLTIEFENFGMRASEDTVAIRSASQVDITVVKEVQEEREAPV